MAKNSFYQPDLQEKTLLIAVEAPSNPTTYITSYYDEFLNLVRTAGIDYDNVIYLKLRDIDTSYFFTKGKLEEVKAACDEHKVERVIISDRLSSQQARNLEDYLDLDIMDRTDLILDIFDKSATSAEGKTQVAIAKLQHEKSRLAGKGVNMSQQMGVQGFMGGPGETIKERERRTIDDLINKLKRDIEKMQKARATQRKQRVGRQIPQMCLIGYTNVGKSTILNALTKSDVLAEDKLFATLDTTTRALFINGKQKGVLSDTVGFIQQLPHHLIDAFKSTLAELQFADLLLQVIDISDPTWEFHIKVVQKILDDLGVKKDMLYVFNKVDKIDNLAMIEPLLEKYEPHVIVSAESKKSLEPLLAFLNEWNPQR